jgi:hypothetical protein
MMDVSELRKRILRALDDARKDAAERRTATDRARTEYEAFLSGVAAPLFRQAATVLRAEGHPFTANTPAGSVRLASDHAADEYIELELDAAAARPQVIGRASFRGRRGLVVEEQPIATGKAIGQLAEEDVSAFLVGQIRKLVSRS